MASDEPDAAAAGTGDRNSKPASSTPKPAHFRITERRYRTIATPDLSRPNTPRASSRAQPRSHTSASRHSRGSKLAIDEGEKPCNGFGNLKHAGLAEARHWRL